MSTDRSMSIPRNSSVPGLWSALLIAAVLASGCRGGPEGRMGLMRGDREAPEAQKEQAAPVVTTEAERGPITASINAASTIEAEKQVTIHAEATGRIISLPIEEGDKVRKGQLLARIKYEAQSSGLDRAQTNLEKARSDYERLEILYRQQAVSKEELESARIAYETAQIDVRDRQRDVRNTRVRAPFSGTITERLVNQGGFISSGAQLFSIIDFDTLVARVYVPEKELDRIEVGQPAQVVGKAAKGREGTGKITRIAPVVDPTTGTVKVTVGLPPELSGGDEGFLPGMYAEVTLTTERREDALLVPKQALVRDDDQSSLFLAKDHRVERVMVETGLSNAEQVEITKGLEPGAEIVVVGQAGLKDGALIRRVDAEGNPLEPDPTESADSGEEKKPDPELANGRKGSEDEQSIAGGA